MQSHLKSHNVLCFVQLNYYSSNIMQSSRVQFFNRRENLGAASARISVKDPEEIVDLVKESDRNCM